MPTHAMVLEILGDTEQSNHTLMQTRMVQYEHGTFLQKEAKTERGNGRWRRTEL